MCRALPVPSSVHLSFWVEHKGNVALCTKLANVLETTGCVSHGSVDYLEYLPIHILWEKCITKKIISASNFTKCNTKIHTLQATNIVPARKTSQKETIVFQLIRDLSSKNRKLLDQSRLHFSCTRQESRIFNSTYTCEQTDRYEMPSGHYDYDWLWFLEIAMNPTYQKLVDFYGTQILHVYTVHWMFGVGMVPFSDPVGWVALGELPEDLRSQSQGRNLPQTRGESKIWK